MGTFHSVLSDGFCEGKLKDLRSPFPLDQPLELDGQNFLHDSDLEDIEDDEKPTDEIPEATVDTLRSPLKSPVFGSGFSSPFSPQIPELESMGAVSSIRGTRSVVSGTHLGKVAVLRDITFVT